MGIATVAESKQWIPGKRTFRTSLSTRHTAEWPPSVDVSSDITVDVGTTSFSLHKFPLVSRSGKIRKLLSEANNPKLCRLHLSTIPGGAEAFELAAKFCYGVSIEITISNVAMLRCAAHFLQMFEEFAEKNLESRTEIYIKEAVLPSVPSSISVLRHCEALLPAAEETNLVGRIIAGIATNVCREQLTSGLSKLEILHGKPTKQDQTEPPSIDWWGNSLSGLSLDFFRRVLSAMKSKGLKQDTVCRILINYANNSLQGSAAGDARQGGGSRTDAETQQRQRAIVEAIVGLLPTQSRKSPVQMAFLSGLLKAAAVASASAICRADLERRIAMQLDQAILEDVLIPGGMCSGTNHHQLHDTDVVVRIFSMFLNLDEEEDGEKHARYLKGEKVDGGDYDFDSHGSPEQSLILKVAKLLDGYLAEVALDANLTPSKFTTLAELLPEHARVVADGLYRAVDIFLKVHPSIKESERYRLCKTINCRKLTQEACSHAAQNERLPVQMAVQVLYFEQMRLRNAMNGAHDRLFFLGSADTPHFLQRPGSGAISPRDNYALVRRENRELKMEIARMRRRLTELEKDHVSMKQELVRSNPAHRILQSFTRKLGRLHELLRFRDFKSEKPEGGVEARLPFQKRRHHSIS
ncbi:hypothetical protein Taro_003846 [Colocasia esculenta]|uniref:Phototropic-responsive NPH3 family protein n=1 Tax=Colocasia esculenta TaxID=4460 RepID=A0A843TKV5_COLES|nr:hypothetical protein [Colocasia esculenta]